MSKEILSLQPERVWKNFYALTQIPRPSKSEEKIEAFMAKFGRDLGLETIVDEVGNVIVRKPATEGMEKCQGVVLQGHLDMVPQKNSDTKHDFEKDPIDAYVDGDWVKARGTTLGADNGMGVAAIMAILESKDIPHGPIEALFTSDEETGMTGAFGLKPGFLKGDILLNLDSEDEGELYVGCAGGVNGNFTFKFKDEAVPTGHVAYKLTVKGLKGGHSGLEIILGRGNSNKLMFRFFRHATKEHGLRIASVDGGSLRNAIPRESFAVVTVPAAQADKFEACVVKMKGVYQKELSLVEPDLSFTVHKAEMPKTVIEHSAANRIINAIYGCPNGVIRMSDAMSGLVETSTNLARVLSSEGKLIVQCLLRSSVDSAKDDLTEMIASVFELAGAEVSFDGGYPGWKPDMNSLILNHMGKVYNKLYSKVPEIKAIHAGLECGLLGGVYPNWDMISFGPTIRFPHSPDEKINVPSVAKFWNFLVETLKSIPTK
ncbi:MAG TPA: aminoacyl-histidine dipeptidase [Williamwhitmania sp.]|nr:aminoacyl-histidine dipeptidase [Williamwhitmania sp.]